MTSRPIFVGVDVGASRTKVAVLDPHKKLIGHSVRKSGIDFARTAEVCLKSALKMAKAAEKDIVNTVATGYGRKNVSFSQESKTEIGCHAKGCYHYFPMAVTVIDIGGQDNKVIKLDKEGRRLSFKMNRKCAAGTGAFLEEMSMRLDIPLKEMDALARKSRNMVDLGLHLNQVAFPDESRLHQRVGRLNCVKPLAVRASHRFPILRPGDIDPSANHVFQTRA